jgi:hypothetical protein
MYKLNQNSTTITRLSDNASIPTDPANSDYREYLTLLSDGYIPIPVDVPTLDDIKATQIAILTAACGAEILSGFTSIALGAGYTYPSKHNDQTNLIGAVASGLPVKFWAKDTAGVWSRPLHTAAQIKQVLVDGATTYQSLSAKLLDLVTTINEATTAAAVQAVVW